MHVPGPNAVDDPSVVLRLLRDAGLGHLVSRADETFESTPLPFLVDDEITVVRAHFSRANPHWRTVDQQAVLFVVPVTDAYVSPNWYPSKIDEPRVVPTWNYEVVHLDGTARVRDDPAFVERVVRDLTDRHEADRAAGDDASRWSVDDAPEDYISRMLRAIVGLEITVDRVVAKRKLSQNRDAADRAGVASGLDDSSRARAAEMSRAIRTIAEA